MRHLLLSILFLSCVGNAQSQVSLKHVNQTINWPLKSHENSRGTINCDVDTVTYVQAKTSNSETKILYSDGTYSSGASQLFWAASNVPITVHGFRWYGYSFDPSGTTNPVLNITCSIYEAGADSLPTGSPLASEIISVDDVPANSQRDVIFTSPVVLNSRYVLVIENPNTDYLFLASNDEDNNDGSGQGLSASYYEPIGTWRKNLSLWALGDFDFVMEPFVSYTMDAKFSNPGSGCVGIPVTFNNTSTGPIQSGFYNQDAFFGNPLSFHWDYGDGNVSANLQNGNNTYGAPGTYNVTLTDTIFMWTGFCTDNQTQAIDIFAIPAAPNSTPPAPVCQYTPALDLTATGSGTNFTWYDDIGLGSLLGTGSPFSSGIILEDTVYVTETVNGCESAGTEVILTFLPNPIPTFTLNNLGGTQTEFQGAPVATMYAWDFGDGTGTSTQQTPTYTFPGAGPFNVCLDVTYSNGCTNQYCENVSYVGVNEAIFEGVAIYPNPANTTLYIDAIDRILGGLFYIHDEQGRLLIDGEIHSYNNRIDLSSLSSGYYFVSIYTSKGFKTFSISKR
jgi:PKD repeat protein